MNTSNRLQSGGSLLVEQLIENNTDLAFFVPGESYLDVLNSMYDKKSTLKLINARHEAGAANMAEAYGKLTGKPGIAFVTRGPGACHASVGIHIAFQDSTPMILLVGDISRNVRDREAFQEVDFKRFFGPISKWVAEINDPDRVPEYLNRAFSLATSGDGENPGPIIKSLLSSKMRDLSIPIVLVPGSMEEKDINLIV